MMGHFHPKMNDVVKNKTLICAMRDPCTWDDDRYAEEERKNPVY